MNFEKEHESVNIVRSGIDQLPNWLINPNLDWKTTRRMSMAEAMAEADREKAFILDQQAQAKTLADSILTQSAQRRAQNQDFWPYLNQILTVEGCQTVTQILTSKLEQIENPFQCALLHKIVSDLVDRIED